MLEIEIQKPFIWKSQCITRRIGNDIIYDNWKSQRTTFGTINVNTRHMHIRFQLLDNFKNEHKGGIIRNIYNLHFRSEHKLVAQTLEVCPNKPLNIMFSIARPLEETILLS